LQSLPLAFRLFFFVFFHGFEPKDLSFSPLVFPGFIGVILNCESCLLFCYTNKDMPTHYKSAKKTAVLRAVAVRHCPKKTEQFAGVSRGAQSKLQQRFNALKRQPTKRKTYDARLPQITPGGGRYLRTRADMCCQLLRPLDIHL